MDLRFRLLSWLAPALLLTGCGEAALTSPKNATANIAAPGESVELRLRIDNPRKRSVRVRVVTVSCTCIKSREQELVVPACGRADLDLTVKGEAPGTVRQAIYLREDGTENLAQVVITVTVANAAELVPQVVLVNARAEDRVIRDVLRVVGIDAETAARTMDVSSAAAPTILSSSADFEFVAGSEDKDTDGIITVVYDLLIRNGFRGAALVTATLSGGRLQRTRQAHLKIFRP